MPKLKLGTILPTPEEDAEITAAALSDPDTYLMTDEEWEKIQHRVSIGGAASIAQEGTITIRLSPEVLDQFRATGADWQTKIDFALRDWLKTHNLSAGL